MTVEQVVLVSASQQYGGFQLPSSKALRSWFNSSLVPTCTCTCTLIVVTLEAYRTLFTHGRINDYQSVSNTYNVHVHVHGCVPSAATLPWVWVSLLSQTEQAMPVFSTVTASSHSQCMTQQRSVVHVNHRVYSVTVTVYYEQQANCYTHTVDPHTQVYPQTLRKNRQNMPPGRHFARRVNSDKHETYCRVPFLRFSEGCSQTHC